MRDTGSVHVQTFALPNQCLRAVCLVKMLIWCQALLLNLPSP